MCVCNCFWIVLRELFLMSKLRMIVGFVLFVCRMDRQFMMCYRMWLRRDDFCWGYFFYGKWDWFVLINFDFEWVEWLVFFSVVLSLFGYGDRRGLSLWLYLMWVIFRSVIYRCVIVFLTYFWLLTGMFWLSVDFLFVWC